jgi:cold shock CspA family protein
MRTHGTLSKWNEAQSSGVITPEEGGDDVYVHMSSMPRDGMRPRLGEMLSYEVETDPAGKSRAVRVFRTGNRESVAAASRRRRAGSALTKKVVGVAVLAVVAWIAYVVVRGGP